MKKKFLRIFTSSLIIAFSLLFLNTEVKADPWGTYLGSFNGVSCYSNGTTGYFCENCYNYYNGTNTGIKWQCVELVNRYYAQIYNMAIRNPPSNANLYFTNASARGLSAFPNGSNSRPQVGDLICSNGGDFGHVAIIRNVSANNDYVDIFQQNWSNNSSDLSKRVNMTYSNGNYTILPISPSYPVQGWLRKPITSGFGKVSIGVNVTPNPVVRTFPFQVSFTLQETGGAPITFDTVVCAILDNNNNFKFDLTRYNNVTLNANGTYQYSVSSTQFGPNTTPGTYKAVARGYKNGWFDFQITGSGVNPRSFQVAAPTGIVTISQISPLTYKLYVNYPNPFNPTTNIKFDIPKAGYTKVKIFDVIGSEITSLVNEELQPGSYKVDWDASSYPSGIYFYKLEVGDFVESKKMILIR